jgi:hypothetical protein
MRKREYKTRTKKTRKIKGDKILSRVEIKSHEKKKSTKQEKKTRKIKGDKKLNKKREKIIKR